MNWSARIIDKSEVGSNNLLTYTFVVLANDQETVTLSVTDLPQDVQQRIDEAVTSFAQSYEIAQELPAVGAVLAVVTDK